MAKIGCCSWKGCRSCQLLAVGPRVIGDGTRAQSSGKVAKAAKVTRGRRGAINCRPSPQSMALVGERGRPAPGADVEEPAAPFVTRPTLGSEIRRGAAARRYR